MFNWLRITVKSQSGLNSSPSGSDINVICIHEKSPADSPSTSEKMLGASWSYFLNVLDIITVFEPSHGPYQVPIRFTIPVQVDNKCKEQ